MGPEQTAPQGSGGASAFDPGLSSPTTHVPVQPDGPAPITTVVVNNVPALPVTSEAPWIPPHIEWADPQPSVEIPIFPPAAPDLALPQVQLPPPPALPLPEFDLPALHLPELPELPEVPAPTVPDRIIIPLPVLPA